MHRRRYVTSWRKILILLECTGPKDLSQYILKDLKIKKGLIEEIKKEQNTIVVEVILKRRLLSPILAAYVSTILLNVNRHAKTFFKNSSLKPSSK